jgi:hypothetical protein
MVSSTHPHAECSANTAVSAGVRVQVYWLQHKAPVAHPQGLELSQLLTTALSLCLLPVFWLSKLLVAAALASSPVHRELTQLI